MNARLNKIVGLDNWGCTFISYLVKYGRFGANRNYVLGHSKYEIKFHLISLKAIFFDEMHKILTFTFLYIYHKIKKSTL